MGVSATLSREGRRPSLCRAPLRAMRCAVLSGALVTGMLASAPAQAQEAWASCLEAVVALQKEMKQTLPRPAQPPSAAQSIAAQDSYEATPESLAAAGVEQPTTGAWGALNEAMNLQAAGNEQGCFQAVAKARQLAGLN